MIVYNRYVNNVDHVWYDSTNVIYSKCYDNGGQTKTLKVVFKEGRTYVYRDVDVDDYVMFKTSESNGKAINTYIIRKYKGVRISDTDMQSLERLREELMSSENETMETDLKDLAYHLKMDETTGEFALSLNGKTIYRGVEGQVSVLNLLKSMSIRYSWEKVDKIENDTDEELDKVETELDK